MDCIGSPTRNSVRPSPSSHPAVSALSSVELRHRRVLELVHQQVLDARAQVEREVRGLTSASPARGAPRSRFR